METYYIGIDGGGTKTTAKIGYRGMAATHELTGGPLNICSTERAAVRETLDQLLGEAAKRMGGSSKCGGVCIGAAGHSHPDTVPFLTRCAGESIDCGKIRITSDAHIALYGALQADVGIILIAGTGSVCYGRNWDSQEWLTGGGGHLIDDPGSGYAVGRDILAAVLQAVDGRAEQTALTQLLAEQVGAATRERIVSFAYGQNGGKAAIASLAPLLPLGCDVGDPVSLDIARRAAEGLLSMVKPVAVKLGLGQETLAFSGGVLRRDPHIAALAAKSIRQVFPALRLGEAKADAAEGARLMAERL